MEYRESSERKSLFIKTLLIIILLLLAFLSSILYVFLYPKTQVILYDDDYNIIDTLTVKRYSKLNIPEQTKPGYTFQCWTYNDIKSKGGKELNPEIEVEDEVVKLYANYNANYYKITYYVKTYDPVNNSYFYNTNVPGCLPQEYPYDIDHFTLPTGRVGGELIPELKTVYGFHFVGWTTTPLSEDNPNIDEHLYYAGQELSFSTPGDLNFYAYWEKNTYDVYMHSGIEYQMELDGVTPKKDDNGKPIIRNILDDVDNERNSYTVSSIRYLDYVTDVSDNFLNITLDAKNATPSGEGVGYTEYDFGGWYLDKDYTLPANSYLAEVKLDGDQPYFSYLFDGKEKRINADLKGLSPEGEKQYAFHLYSKWTRRSYNVTFNKNNNGSSGRLDKIELYKHDDEYGKYYDNGYFTREGYAEGTTYTKINFLDLFQTEEFDRFANSYRDYRLLGFTTTPSRTAEGCEWYYEWKQDAWNESLLTSEGNKVFNPPVRDNYEYIHGISENLTLYAQWSKIYTIKFAYAAGANQKNFTIQGIDDEWFWLPDEEYITNVSGSMWTKLYNDFAGWRSATNSLNIKKLKKEDGSLNSGFYYQIDKSNATFYVYWTQTPYTITFYQNDGTEGTVDYPICYGGVSYSFPRVPERPGYIFNGWSSTKYADNEYVSTYRESNGVFSADKKAYAINNSTFTVTGDASYYATWTVDYVIEYEPNQGVVHGSPSMSTTYFDLYKASKSHWSSSNTRYYPGLTDMTLYANIAIARYINVTRDNYNLVGWQIKINDTSVAEDVLYESNTANTTFDFLNKVYYPKPATTNSIVPDSSKNPLYFVSGNKVVLVAKWEAVKYDIKIQDSNPVTSTKTIQIFKVAFNEAFVFPINNAQGIPYDNKIGYKLIGFSTNQNTDAASVEYLYDKDNMPVIPANTITGGITYHTIYTKMSINLSYWIENPDDKTQVMKYSPSGAQYLSGSVSYGTTVAALPTPASSWYPTSKYSFKYWFYYDANGNEVEFGVGDQVQYHDEDRNLKLFAKFELEQYIVNFIITSPYNNNATLKTLNSAFVVEKGSKIETSFMTEINDLLYSEFTELFGDNYLGDGILKGYTFKQLGELNYRENILEANKTFTSSYFEYLKNNPASITFVTVWESTVITLNYSNNINGTTLVKTLLFGDNTAKTAPADIFDFSATNQFVGSWDVDGQGVLYLACDSKFIDGSLVKTYNDLMPYITFFSDGRGKLNLVANTEQICYVYYYIDDGSAVESQSFTLGQAVSLTDGNAYMSGDYKFAGWYYNGELISDLPELNEENGYIAHIYADKTIDITYRNIVFTGNAVNYQIDKVDTIHFLKYNNGIYTYITSYTLSYYPEQTDLNGYVYYGLTDDNKIYSIDDIENNNASILVSNANITLDVCLCKEYEITYSLTSEQISLGATFTDGSTNTKSQICLITNKGIAIEQIKINYNATLKNYSFVGWKIVGDVTDSIYYFDTVFTPYKDTQFVAYFNAPEANTIDAIIKLLSGDGSNREDSVNVTNTDIYTFRDDVWTSGTKLIYAWLGEDGKEYGIGDTFTVPLAIDQGTIYTFTALWVDKYTVNFVLDANHQNAVLNVRNVSVVKGGEYVLTNDNEPTIAGAGVELNYWLYVDKYGNPILFNGEEVHVNIGDKVIFGGSAYKYIYYADGSADYTLPVPSDNDNFGYYFLSVWNSKQLKVTFNIVDESGNILTNYQFEKMVEYGSSLDGRGVIPSNVLALETNTRGILGWTTSTTDFTTVMPNILKNISSELVVYSVWQGKFTLSFATGSTYDYTETISNTYYLPSEEIDINSVISKVYYVDTATVGDDNTVYFDGEKFLFIKQNNNFDTYYRLTGFAKSTGGTITLLDNVLPTFTINSDVVLTPIFTKVYKITFYDNTNSTGGNVITTINPLYLAENTNFNIAGSGITYSREGFTFGGWNSDLNGADGLANVVIGKSNISLYAIWNSSRSAIFRFKTGTNEYNNLFTIAFNKDNKISATLLDRYLNGEEFNGNLNPIASLQALGHPAYNYNFENWYLTGFSAGANTYTYSELVNKVFTESSDIYITLNTERIYTITFNLGSASGTMGELPADMYFVSLSNGNVGMMVANGEFSAPLVLPTELSITKENYTPYAWATGEGSSATKYPLNTNAVNLTALQLTKIAAALNSNNTSKYTLYLLWEYKKISIAVYNLANDTFGALEDPYNAYSNSLDESGLDIAFNKTPTWVYLNNSSLLSAGTDSDWQDKLPQVPYNSRLYFCKPASFTNSANGYRLIGFSTTLCKLGQIPETYYTIDDTTSVVKVDSTVIESGDIVYFYPVFELITEKVTIAAENGKFRYTISSGLEAKGYVSAIDEYTTDILAISEFTINKYSIINLDASYPTSGEYILNTINGVKVTTPNHLFGYNQGDNSLFTGHQEENYSHLIEIVYSTKLLNVTLSLEYEVELVDGVEDTTNLGFEGVLADDTEFSIQLSKTYTTYTNQMYANEVILYKANSNCYYYEYEFYNGDTPLTFYDRGQIRLDSLNVSDTPNADGAYDVNIRVVAKPYSYKVTFSMFLGVFKEGTVLPAVNEIYKGVTSFEIVNNIAYVYENSFITLPTADDITYVSGKFNGFTINGDLSGTLITTHNVMSDIIFVENYERNFFTVQYIYNGQSKQITNIPAGFDLTVGSDCEEALNQDGLTFLYWGDANGTKLFDNGTPLKINQNYILYAQYEGKALDLVYVYDGNAGKVSPVIYGNKVKMIDYTELSDATHYDDKYIYGWQVDGAGDVLVGGSIYEFSALSSTYKSEIILNAVYMPRYKYTIIYDDSNISNSGSLPTQTVYVHTSSIDGSSYLVNDLNVKLHSIAPISNAQDGNTKQFVHYTLSISTDGVDYEAVQEDTYQAGSMLTLDAPVVDVNNSEDKVYFFYKLFAYFDDSEESIEIEYVITNPTAADRNTVTASNTLATYTMNILPDITLLTDVYLPNNNYANSENSHTNFGNNTGDFLVAIKGETVEITEDIDWNKYTLKGYKVELLGTNTTKEFIFGDNSSRGVSGALGVRMYPIWEDNYTITYLRSDDSEITELKTYIKYDTTEKVTLADNPGGLDVANSTIIGWSTSTSLDEIKEDNYFKFSSEIDPMTLILYPTYATHYNVTVVTAGVFYEDKASFKLKEMSLYTYYGNVLSFENIDCYEQSDLVNYTFLGYSLSPTGDELLSRKEYVFSYDDIDESSITIYAIWDKKSSLVTIQFVGSKNGISGNMLSAYSLNVKVYSGDTLDLSYDSELNAFNNENIDNQYQKIVSAYDYLTFNMFTDGVSAITESELSPNVDIEIYMLFKGVVRLVYTMDDDAEYLDFVAYDRVIKVGDIISNVNPISNVSHASKIAKYWTAKGNNFFDDEGKHEITPADLNYNYLNEEYELELYVFWETAYKFNLYYFANETDFANEHYTPLYAEPISVELFDILGYIEEDAEGNKAYISSLDSDIAALGITGVDSLYDLLNMFNHYTASTVFVNDYRDITYAIWVGDMGETYKVQSYTGDALVNNVYLIYTAKTYKVSISSGIANKVDEDLIYSTGGTSVYAEVAFNDTQLEDDGSNTIPNMDQRQIVSNDSLEADLKFDEYIYLFDEKDWVRANSMSRYSNYQFVGWKMLVEDIDDNGDKTYKFVDITGVTLDNAAKYTKLYNITSDIQIFAVFTLKEVEVEVTIVSSVANNDQMNVKISLSDDNVNFVDLNATPVNNVISFTVKYGQYIVFNDSNIDDIYTLEKINIKGSAAVRYEGDSINVTAYLVGSNEKLQITINYSIAKTNVYFSTSVSDKANNEFIAYINKLSYKFGANELEQTAFTNLVTPEIKNVNNKSFAFNYYVTIEQTSIFDSALISLYNYNFIKWQYINAAGELEDISNLADLGEITDDIYLVAVFEPKSIHVKYVVQDFESDGVTKKEVVLKEESITYGEYYIMPYIVYESNYVVTTGWRGNDLSLVAWGSQKLMSSTYNDSDMSLTPYIIYATTVNNYYINLVNEYNTTQTFTPLYVVAQEVSIKDGVAYTRITNYNGVKNQVNITAADNVDGVTIATNRVTLPSKTAVGTEIELGEQKTFAGWKSAIKTYTIDNGLEYKYDSREVTDATKHEIKLTVLVDTSKVIKFVVTNPENNEDLLVYTKADYSTGEGDAISFVVDLEDKNSLNSYVNLTADKSNKYQWSIIEYGQVIKNYFANNSKIGTQYKLHGWAIAKGVNYETAYANADGQWVTLYQNNLTTLKYDDNILGELWDLISSGEYTFYPIWEEKVEVKFYDTASKTNVLSSGYYAKGEVLDEPNPENGVDLSTETLKWIGWKTAHSDGVEYLFDDNNISIVFNEYSEFIPAWEEGYSITIDTNFDDVRTLYGNIMQGYVGVTAENIVSTTGYPQYVGTDADIVGELYSTINGVKYFTTYKYGGLWLAGSEINLATLIDRNFSHEGIYKNDYELSDNAGSVKDKYFTLVGWKINDSDELVTNLSSITVGDKNITLTAVWQGVDISIDFYNKQAEKKLSHTIKFGDKLSSLTFDHDGSDATAEVLLLEYYGSQREFYLAGFRFNNWIAFDVNAENVLDGAGNPNGAPYGNNSVLSGNMSVITDMTLYPMYLESFELLFKNGDNVVTLVADKDFVSGEYIDVNYYLSQITNVNTISKVYYISSSFNEVDITEYKNDNANELQFVESEWYKNDGMSRRYIVIYYLCELTLSIYLPDSANPTGNAVEHIPGGTKIAIGTLVSIYEADNNLFKNIDLSVYVGDVTLYGWYYSNLAPNKYYADASAYVLNESPLRYFKVVYDGTSYKLNVTRMDDSTDVIDLGQNMAINIYAKLTIETTVRLGNGGQQIFDYASLEYNAETNKNYFAITSTNYVSSYVYSITYTSVYKSAYTPVFTISTNAGYVVTSVSGLSNFIDRDDDTIIYNGEFNLDSSSSGTKATLTRRLTNTNAEDMLFTHTLQLTESTYSGNTYSIEISIITYNVTYTYDHTISSIRYKKTDDSYMFDFTTGNSYTHINESYIYSNGVIINSYEVNYQFVDGKVEYTGVPYGTKIYVDVYPNDSMHYHFVEWEVTNNNLGIVEQYTQTIMPSDKVSESTTHLSRNVNLNAIISENEISAINLVLDVEITEDESTKPWINVLNEAVTDINTVGNTVISQKDGRYYILIDTISVSASTYSARATSLLKAGSNISSTIENINEYYHERYNMRKGERNGNKWTIASLLNYFLARDTEINFGWFTYANSTEEILTTDGDIYAPYVEGGAVVTLHKLLDRALLVNVDSKVVDYENTSAQIDVDRANIKLAGDYTDYYVFVESSNNHGYTENTEVESLTVKMPFSTSVQFEVVPDVADGSHVNYVLDEWLFNDTYSKIYDGAGAITARGNIVEVNTGNELISQAWSYYEKMGQPISIPDLKLCANVKANPYFVEFRSDGVKISDIQVVYDKEIFDKDQTLYSKYSTTLDDIYNNGYMPRFVLMPKSAHSYTEVFKHREDATSVVYGQFKYLFTGWTKEGESFATDTVIKNDDYSRVIFDADYYATSSVDIVTYSFDNNVKNSITNTIYLPRTALADQFGSVYSENILSVDARLLPFNYASGSVYDTYYVKGNNNASHTLVSKMSEIIVTEQSTIYPAVEKTLTVVENEIYSDEITTMTLITLGGKLDVQVVSTTNGSMYVGYILLSNIVYDGDLAITYDRGFNYPGYSFAYWILSDNSLLTYLSTSGDYSYYGSNISLTAHYNSKIYFTNSEGALTVTGNDGDRNQWLQLSESIPSGVEIAENSNNSGVDKSSVYITYSHFVAGEGSDLANAQAKVYRDGTLLYTVDYTAAYSIIAKIAFKVYGQNSEGADILLKTLHYEDSYYLEDSMGQIRVEAIGYPNEVTIEFEPFAITNFMQYSDENPNLVVYNKTSGSYLVDGAIAITIEDLSRYNSINGVSTEISFGNKLTVVATGTTATVLNDNIKNLRWQYLDTLGNWVDMNPNEENLVDYSYGSSKDSPFMKFRLACEWISSSVTFAKLSTTSSSLLGKDSINGYNLNFSFSNYSLNSQTIELLRSESVEYNHVNMTFTIISSLRNDLSGTVIEVTDNNGFMQGWVVKDSQEVNGLSADETFTDFSKSYTFYSWVEPAKTISIYVDNESAVDYVAGYGRVSFGAIHALKADESGDFALDKNTRTYGLVTLGESSIISLSAEVDSTICHEFEGFRESGHSTTDVNNSIYAKASTIANEVYARFNAKNTESEYYLVNDSSVIQHTVTIYGGYEITHIENPYTRALNITVLDMFGSPVESVFAVSYTYSEDKQDRTYYPSLNSTVVSVIYKYFDTNVTDSNGVIIESISGSSVKGETLKVNGSANPIVVKYIETITAVTVYVSVIDTDGNYLSYGTAGGVSGQDYSVFSLSAPADTDKHSVSMRYDLNTSGIELNVFESYVGNIAAYGDYKLKSAVFMGGGEDCEEEYPQSIGNNTELYGTYKTSTVSSTVCYLYIYVIERQTRNVYLYSTLPYAADLERLAVSIEGDYSSRFGTYDLIPSGTFVNYIEIPKNAYVKATSTGSGYKLSIFMDHITYLSITYTLPEIYSYDGSTGFKLSTANGYNITNETEWYSGSSMLNYYKAFGYDYSAATDITSSAVPITDCAIILAISRNNVEVINDNTYFSKIDDTSESYWINSYFNKSSNYKNPTSYTFPGGLGILWKDGGRGTDDGGINFIQENCLQGSSMWLKVEDTDVRGAGGNISGSISTTFSTINIYVDPRLIVISENNPNMNSSYSIDLWTDTTWAVLCMPATTNWVGVSFYNDTSTSQLGTGEFYRDSSLILEVYIPTSLQSSVDNLTFTRNMNKNWTTALYEGLNGATYGYKYQSINFSPSAELKNAWIPTEWVLALTGYEVVCGNNTVIYGTVDINDVTSIQNLSPLFSIPLTDYSKHDSIRVYPIWQLVPVYKVEIEDKVFNDTSKLPRENYIIQGQDYCLDDITISSIALDHNYERKGDTRTYYTMTIGDYVLMRFDTISGTYVVKEGSTTILNCDRYDLYQIANCASGYKLTITPSSDILFSARWEHVGYSVQYHKTSTADFMSKRSDTYNYYTCLDSMYFVPFCHYEQTECPYCTDAHHFKLADYYDSEDFSNCVTSMALDKSKDNIYYTITHSDMPHCIGEYQWYNGPTPEQSCYFENREYCKYKHVCDYDVLINEWSNHDWEVYDYEFENLAEHYKYSHCTRRAICKVEDKKELEPHSIKEKDVSLNPCTTQHVWYCELCKEDIASDPPVTNHLDLRWKCKPIPKSHSLFETMYNTHHVYDEMCYACGYDPDPVLEKHGDDGVLRLFSETKAEYCTLNGNPWYDTKKYICDKCEYAEIEQGDQGPHVALFDYDYYGHKVIREELWIDVNGDGMYDWDNDDWVPDYDRLCTEDYDIVHTCSLCSILYKDGEINASCLAHDTDHESAMGVWIERKQLSLCRQRWCLCGGGNCNFHSNYCTKCTYIEYDYTHNWKKTSKTDKDGWEVTTAPTCTTAGAKKRICKDCKLEETTTIPKAGHSYKTSWSYDSDEWVGNCTWRYRYHECTYCGHVNPTDDSYVNSSHGYSLSQDNEYTNAKQIQINGVRYLIFVCDCMGKDPFGEVHRDYGPGSSYNLCAEMFVFTDIEVYYRTTLNASQVDFIDGQTTVEIFDSKNDFTSFNVWYQWWKQGFYVDANYNGERSFYGAGYEFPEKINAAGGSCVIYEYGWEV